MLQAEKDCEQDWDFVVEAVEGSDIVLVLAVQGPNIWCDKVQVVLQKVRMINGFESGDGELHSHRSIPPYL